MRYKWLKGIVFGLGLLAASVTQAEVKEGKDYKLLSPARQVEVPGKIEVIEFFWYGCPHCKTIEPFVDTWAKKLPKDVNFRRVHVVWQGRNDIEAHAKLFAALQAMGQDARLQNAIFKAVQQDRIELRRESTLFDWLKKQGVDVNQFKSHYGSFTGNIALKKMEQTTQNYGIDGVPVFVVNGKYMTSPAILGKEDATLTRVLDELIAKERPAAAGKKKKK
ncbi:thiol:disulfide interchange protein DsbA [Formivibrio citricus]|uniref:Thiol:disulfide interchange protein n=1 Tax=Formivibrio citricus TaxID=83765 RepID=A0A1I5C2R1_9NEIS|nr:thiol:disulfide interchange protein DsbA/DsbL [Formivibrio citricus]SFN81258.1 thiol:disulfide interchange protein DsbA [Formivibrio citricus]